MATALKWLKRLKSVLNQTPIVRLPRGTPASDSRVVVRFGQGDYAVSYGSPTDKENRSE